MTRDEAVSRIQMGLAFRTNQADNIVKWLKEAQRDLERGKTLPRFLLVEGAALSLLVGNHEVALPSNFLRRRMPSRIRYVPSGDIYPRYVEWRDYDDILRAYDNFSPSFPVVAALRSATIFFGPAADQNYSLTWDYYKKANVLTEATSTNEWLDDDNIPEVLIGEAGFRAAAELRDADAVASFTAMKKTARSSLFADTIAQESDDGPFFLGSNN